MISSDYQNRVVDSYDIIVIGAGLGGLGAAAKLALAGKNVLLLEKHAVPGGFATSFVRGRFEFEAALHELSGLGNEETPGALYHFFNELGILNKDIEFNRIPEIYRCIYPDGLDESLPFGVEEYQNKLIEIFPRRKEEIIKLMDVCKKVGAGLSYVGSQGGKINPLKILFKHTWLARVAGLTAEEFITKFTTDVKLIDVFTQLWAYYGLPPSQCNAVLFIAAQMGYLKHGAYFPKGRSHAMSSAIANRIQKLGGTIRYNALVDKIIMEGDKIKGVELLNGDVYLANAIISNVNPICTTMKMLPPKTMPDWYIKKLSAPQIANSVFNVHLGLNASPKELQLHSYEVFMNTSYDIEAMNLAPIDDPKSVACVCYNVVDENISPPGTTSLVLTALQYGREWHNISAAEYFKFKDKAANKMIKIVEDMYIPNIRDYIEVAEAATPLTYYRYSKNLDGTIYGMTNTVYDSPIFRLKSNTPLKNLYFCGAWTNTGGGYEPSLESGMTAAHMFLQKDNKEKKGGVA
jgi:phytoene dehydrogenase-like protein